MPSLDFLHASPFYEITALLVLAAAAGFIGLLLRQPMIVSFIAVGVIAGPSALGIVGAHEHIEILSELGIAVLLFLVGLKLDLNLIRTLGPVSVATGLGQVFLTSLTGFFIGIMMGFDVVTALYVSLALTLSSTIIIIKLLSDKKEVDSLHGRIAVGLLIVQDICVVFAMIALSAFNIDAQAGGAASASVQVAGIIVCALLMLVFVCAFIRFVATPLVEKIAHSTELLIVFAIAWAALLASAGDYFGLGKEIGGLLAGISLASTPFREAIISRLSSLRDFLLLFFFVGLGMHLDISAMGEQIYPALVFSIFVLIGNPLIMMAIVGFMGYRKRTSFLAGLTVAQISEFSLIFMAMGVSLGHINAGSLGLVTLVGLITIALSVYMITYSNALYRWFEPALSVFERKVPVREKNDVGSLPHSRKYDVILFGLGRYGAAIADHLKDDNLTLLAVDFNPDEVRNWQAMGYDAVYGDACDHEFIATLPLKQVRWVISAIPQHDLGITHQDPRLILIDALKKEGFTGKVAVTSQNLDERDALERTGADVIFLPFHDAAERAVARLKEMPSTERIGGLQPT